MLAPIAGRARNVMLQGEVGGEGAWPGGRGLMTDNPRLNNTIPRALLHCLSWFGVGTGGIPEAPGRPTEGYGGPPGGLRTPRGRGQTNLKTHTFCRAFLNGPGSQLYRNGGSGGGSGLSCC